MQCTTESLIVGPKNFFGPIGIIGGRFQRDEEKLTFFTAVKMHN
jgi:hypothetical protein